MIRHLSRFLTFCITITLCAQTQAQQIRFIIDSPGEGLIVSEDLTTASFSLSLSVAPGAAVSVDLDLDDHSEAEFFNTPATLVFTDQTWNIPQVVTVRGKDDFDLDGDIDFIVTAGPSVSGDPAFSGLSYQAQGKNLDNDAIPEPTTALLLSFTLLPLTMRRNKAA